ncbi:MAG: hypothetical protein F6J93_14665 [Oscillatoria sp. SIO1A7]|nr:hypothetical protein [Oscillatoria sp. SIO1A7]
MLRPRHLCPSLATPNLRRSCVPRGRSLLLHGFLGEAFQYNNFYSISKGYLGNAVAPTHPPTHPTLSNRYSIPGDRLCCMGFWAKHSNTIVFTLLAKVVSGMLSPLRPHTLHPTPHTPRGPLIIDPL